MRKNLAPLLILRRWGIRIPPAESLLPEGKAPGLEQSYWVHQSRGNHVFSSPGDEDAPISSEDNALTRALANLLVEPPEPLSGRLFAGWVEVGGPSGCLLVGFTDEGIAYVRPASAFDGHAGRFAEEFRQRFGRPILPAKRPPAGLVTALRTGRSRALPFDLRGQSPFEQAVLRKALEIPRGETRPYAWIAAQIGRPRAVRAAGSALGRNPVPILIPCHRVVREDGEIGNYIFGSLVKEELLKGEGVSLEEAHAFAAAGIRFLGSDTTHIVCYPTCHAARRIAPVHRTRFKTLTQAVGAGYRPCSLCRPAPAWRATQPPSQVVDSAPDGAAEDPRPTT
jgi:O-6-methylguanine DNA methyltransferase